MELLIAMLDKVANAIQAKGLLKEAEELDIIANTLEGKCRYCGGTHGKWNGPFPIKGDKVEAWDIKNLSAPGKDGTYTVVKVVPDIMTYLGKRNVVYAIGSSGEESFPLDCVKPINKKESCEVEAAKKKKKKWIPKKLEEGRLSKYKKPGESMAEAAQRARKSDDPSVRGMGNLYLNVFHKKEAAELSEAERIDFVFPANNPKVKDKRGHFPIPDKAHGQNALARVNQYGSVPSWYDGSLEDLKKTVVDKVEAKFPTMEIEEEKFDK